MLIAATMRRLRWDAATVGDVTYATCLMPFALIHSHNSVLVVPCGKRTAYPSRI